MCGGTKPGLILPELVIGLSPRVRGNLEERKMNRRIAGSIPACAGEPLSAVGQGNLPLVYPRVCGGTGIIYPLRHTKHGLSPRVRGNLGKRRHRIGVCRSIPACAGEPAAPSSAKDG